MQCTDGRKPADCEVRGLSEVVRIPGRNEFQDTENLPESQASDRPLYRLTLRPEPEVDGILALRGLLKVALRTYGLRCIAVEQVSS